jgi:N12 class adenine-specific DNA methylase
MPTNVEMARFSHQAKALEKHLLRYVKVHRLAPLRVISSKFGISELHAYAIISNEERNQEPKRLTYGIQKPGPQKPQIQLLDEATERDKLRKIREQLLAELSERESLRRENSEE